MQHWQIKYKEEEKNTLQDHEKNEQTGLQFMFVKIMGPFKTIMHIDDQIGILPFQDLNMW